MRNLQGQKPDNKLSVNQLGQQLGIPETFLYGECDQNQKQKIIQQIKKQNTLNYGKNNKVMMIGDGLNDILSLKEADVGVSINSKSELNLIACDVIMLNQNLWKLKMFYL
ncbi:HAD-like domain [Pseudocohnilembus persalinus]|uniref:HAD-like domain n=1 Tax=Pseudocohnilembus persalinus TaxID=266149 RepID=A0A0V0QWI6_PSEPJ|nr:HAD-like domain [Pseudocohnilembus persalinus]|eukprot:KRX06245.1 HAD-like domain [Pseudocohnilembus persalinus]